MANSPIRFARAAFLTLFAALLPCAGQQPVKKPVAKLTKAAGPAPVYVGLQTCALCHEDIARSFEKSPHQVVNGGDYHGFKGNGCESCHGPGGKHADTLDAADIRNFKKISPAEVDLTCLTCHRNQPTTSGRLEASHARNAIACTQCHVIHGPQSLVARKRADVNALCETCHIDVKASFQQPFKHPVPENAMTCLDCHNPHGSVKPGLMRLTNANEPGCFSCHADKRGPFTYEHPPMRFEGCQSCHMPHGSENPRMLIRQEVHLVCLECHANLPPPNSSGIVLGVVPPAFHDLHLPQFRNCTTCHQKVHGSHVDRNFLR